MVKIGVLNDMARRRASIPRPGADITDLEDLDLIGVSLVARTPSGPVEVPGLALYFNRLGLRVRREDGSSLAAIPWATLVTATTDAVAGGEYASVRRVTMDLASDRRKHRFIVPYANALALGAAINTLSSRYADRRLVEAPRGAKLLSRRT